MQQASIRINNKAGISMKMKLKIGWILVIVSITTGCASINDNPYYKIWHDQIFVGQALSGLDRGNLYEGVNTLATQPLIEEGAYALESDPFRSYATPSFGRRAGQIRINEKFFSSH
jgi:hypothetical protein